MRESINIGNIHIDANVSSHDQMHNAFLPIESHNLKKQQSRKQTTIDNYKYVGKSGKHSRRQTSNETPNLLTTVEYNKRMVADGNQK